MKSYIKTIKPKSMPQMTVMEINDKNYKPDIWHTTIDQYHGPKTSYPAHQHNVYHINLYTKGCGEYLKGSDHYTAQPGTCVITSPGTIHDFVSFSKTAVYSEITFAYQDDDDNNLSVPFERLLSIYAGYEIVFQLNPTLDKTQMQTLQSLLVQITDYLNSGKSNSHYLAHRTLTNIFDFLIERCCKKRQRDISKSWLEKSKTWIEQNYPQQFSMDELAEEAGVSKGYFFRAFKKAFGSPPVTYQQQLRIEAAKTLLRSTSLHCNEIAHRVGFTDVCFFHRVFKKRVGVSPKQYSKT